MNAKTIGRLIVIAWAIVPLAGCEDAFSLKSEQPGVYKGKQDTKVEDPEKREQTLRERARLVQSDP